MKGESQDGFFRKHYTKGKMKAFTIAELAVIIAVIAVMAAVFAPSFSGLLTKAESTAALAQAKSCIDEVLICDAAMGASDIVVITEKGGKLFAFGYDYPYGRIISYVGNPIGKEDDLEFINADDVPYIIPGVSPDGKITEEKSSGALIFKGVTIEADFEREEMMVMHNCLDFLKYHAEIPATCTSKGTKAYYLCENCGNIFEKSPDGDFSPCENTEIPQKEHEYINGKCRCGKSEKPDEWSGKIYFE